MTGWLFIQVSGKIEEPLPSPVPKVKYTISSKKGLASGMRSAEPPVRPDGTFLMGDLVEIDAIWSITAETVPPSPVKIVVSVMPIGVIGT